jgi:hypothetical protein
MRLKKKLNLVWRGNPAGTVSGPFGITEKKEKAIAEEMIALFIVRILRSSGLKELKD